ncbi:hypothetical protein [Leptospira haakeii]|uniref:SH3b domain-containing protein n=1 Tax=Leptospira haakeii TaxID=2023198 RepID=A0ABX4PMK5_9LEPT|nr:hypothetical protein [Leptospira haakeii]PKA16136.1 hypothetical protein CH363_08275 [Leptospira haakeii]PKA18084.1 hypothetical protein CH377_19465 [Leptospira haakeii]
MVNKRKIIAILVVLLSCNTGNQRKERLISIEKVIKENMFLESSGIHALSLKFNEKNSYEFGYGSEGWYWSNTGSYSVVEGSIILKAKFCGFDEKQKRPCSETFGDGSCDIEKTPLDIEYEYSFVCKSKHKFKIYMDNGKPSDTISFPIKQFLNPIGSERTYKNYKIITLGNVTGVVTDSVVLRTGPGINYPKRDYVVNVYDGPYLKSLPKETKVIIHGRTVEKEKVKDWENYWLLISVGDTDKAWAYGQFFSY